MGKSSYRINKEIEQEKYKQTALGKLEKELRRIYGAINQKSFSLTPEQQVHIDKLRKEAGETILKANEEYSQDLQNLKKAFEDKKKEAETGIDVLAVSLMNKEVEYLQGLEKTANGN